MKGNVEWISDRQAICLIVMFIIGSAIVLGSGHGVTKDIWLAVLLSTALSIIFILIYARVLSLHPGQNLPEILTSLFGKWFGGILILSYTWYAFHLGALVLRNFGEFIVTIGLNETPQLVPVLFLGALSIWGVKAGIEVLGRWAEMFIGVVLSVLVVSTLLLLPSMNFDNLRPIFQKGFTPVLTAAYGSFSFPMAETVIFMMVFGSIKKRSSIKKVYTSGLLLAGLLLVIVAIRNVSVLGDVVRESVYFPSYTAVSRISLGNFLERLEILVVINFILAGFIKICICLLAASKGIASLAGFKDYRFLVTPVGLLMVGLSYFIYENIMEMVEWAFEIYPYYSIPFQIVFPLLIWVVAEIRHKTLTK